MACIAESGRSIATVFPDRQRNRERANPISCTIAAERKPTMMLLPYGIPIAIAHCICLDGMLTLYK